MDFLMADRAVPVARRTEVMESRGDYTESCLCRSSRARNGQVSMALQTDESDLLPGEHPWIRRSVRLVTARAAFQSHGRVFERERSSLITVATEAARLIGRKVLQHA